MQQSRSVWDAKGRQGQKGGKRGLFFIFFKTFEGNRQRIKLDF